MLSVLVICSNPLRVSLRNLERMLGSMMSKSLGKPERSDEFDCTLCLKLLFEPITTPCGHSFCRSCLFQSMDRGQCFAVLSLYFQPWQCIYLLIFLRMLF